MYVESRVDDLIVLAEKVQPDYWDKFKFWNIGAAKERFYALISDKDRFDEAYESAVRYFGEGRVSEMRKEFLREICDVRKPYATPSQDDDFLLDVLKSLVVRELIGEQLSQTQEHSSAIYVQALAWRLGIIKKKLEEAVEYVSHIRGMDEKWNDFKSYLETLDPVLWLMEAQSKADIENAIKEINKNCLQLGRRLHDLLDCSGIELDQETSTIIGYVEQAVKSWDKDNGRSSAFLVLEKMGINTEGLQSDSLSYRVATGIIIVGLLYAAVTADVRMQTEPDFELYLQVEKHALIGMIGCVLAGIMIGLGASQENAYQEREGRMLMEATSSGRPLLAGIYNMLRDSFLLTDPRDERPLVAAFENLFEAATGLDVSKGKN